MFILNSVTRLGYFWNILETLSRTKLAQILGNFLLNFKNLSSSYKNALAPFVATWVKIGRLLVLEPGLTDFKQNKWWFPAT